MSASFTLCVDLDGVVGDYEAAFRSYVAETLGVPPSSIGPVTEWDFAACPNWPITTRDQYLELHQGAVEAGMFATMPFLPGVSDALWALSDAGVHLRIVTHRLITNFAHDRVVTDTVSWLNQPRPDNGKPSIPFRDLLFLGDKPQIDGDLFVDDGPHNIEGLREAGAEAVVFDAGYNRHLPGPRVTNWVEMYELVMAKMAWLAADPTARAA